MSRFCIKLTQDQFTVLSSKLPDGYLLKKSKGNFKTTTQLHDDRSSKDDNPLNDNYSSESPFQDLQTQHQSGKEKSIQKRPSKPASQNTSKERKSDHLKSDHLKLDASQKTKYIQARNDLILDLCGEIERKKSAAIFIEPVDPVKLQIPTYFQIIKHPMDLKAITKNIKSSRYDNFEAFQKDLGQIVWNCLTFNAGNDIFMKIAQNFEKDYKNILHKNRKKISQIQRLISIPSISSANEQVSRQYQQPNSEEQEKSKEEKLKQKKKAKASQSRDLTKDIAKKKLGQNQKEVKKVVDIKEKIKDNPSDQQVPLKKDKIMIGHKIQSFQKTRNANLKPKLNKKFSIQDRLTLIERIRKLDKATMGAFFKSINFTKGQALDFKVLEDEQIERIEVRLQQFEKVDQGKLKKNQGKPANDNSKQKVAHDFQIAQDEDYND